MLHKPPSYFGVLAHFAFNCNLGNDASQLQLPSVHHNPSCDKCAHYAKEKEENAKKVWWKKCSQRKAEHYLDLSIR